jgi:hypothetical protein
MKEFDQKYSSELCKISIRAIEEGWHRVNLVEILYENIKYYESWRNVDERAPVILEWCKQNSSDEWCEFAGKFYFKNEHDVSFFALKWCKQ